MSTLRYILIGSLLLIAMGFALPTPMREGPRTMPASDALTHEKHIRAEQSDFFTSPAGIVYGKDWSGKFSSRVAHIMAHTQPDPSKQKHSVFIEKTREGVLAMLDEAWKKRGPPTRQGGSRGRDMYDVPMGRVIGTEGERNVRMIVEKDSADIVTAYPTR